MHMKEQSSITSTALERTCSSRSTSGVNYSLRLPDRRSQPLLIKQWQYLWREEFVELRRGLEVTDAGRVDGVTADGTTIWVHLASIHR